MIFHYLVTEQDYPLFEREKIELVSLGYGRFIDSEMKQIAIDEPIVLAGGALWMNRRPTVTPIAPTTLFEFPSTITHSYLDSLQEDLPHAAKTFAKCLAFYFLGAFPSKPKLTDIFAFPDPVPAWAKQTAELVEVHATEDGQIAPLLSSVLILSVPWQRARTIWTRS